MSDEDARVQQWLADLRDGLESEKPEARRGLARVFEQRGMLEEATDLLIANINAGERNAQTYRWLARLYRAQDQEALSLQAASEAARLMPASDPIDGVVTPALGPPPAPQPQWQPAKGGSALGGCVKAILITVGVIVMGFLSIGVLAALFGGGSGPRVQEPSDAKIVCRKWVRDRLRAPSTAQFPSYSDETATKLSDGNVLVRSYVDAQNSFGAQIRTHYTCIARPAGGDEWTLVSLNM